MNTLLAKILLVVLMSHGLRLLGRMVGPRWGALALGLPCTTAVALAGCGIERGVMISRDMADHCLLGLTGVVALPLAFAESTRRGYRLGTSVLIAALAYFSAAWFAGHIGPFIVGGSLGLACIVVLAGLCLAARVPIGDLDAVAAEPPSKWQLILLRTVVPIACLLAVLTAGELAGPHLSGILGTFPGVGLTLLILTFLEGGRNSALRLAVSLPSGNLGMVAFLACYRFASTHVNLGWGMAAGYLAAVTVLAAVAVVGTRWTATSIGFHRRIRRLERSPIWPKPGRSFFPKVEILVA